MEMPWRLGAKSCDLHPQEDASAGTFCPSCLRDRLQGLDAPRRSTSALPLASLVSLRGGPSSSHLRRCKSFSARPASSLPRATTQETSADMKPMKIHIDLESQSRCRDAPAPNFWIRKWHQWRNKHNAHRKHHHYATPMPPPPQNPIPHGVGFAGSARRPRRCCDTQSELAGARRSCDADPRFSFDCPPRFSLDEPRASCDGYSASGRPVYSRLHYPVLSAAVEDAPFASIGRCDDQIPVLEDETGMPGSQAQTRDYYLDSSTRRRRSLDRSASAQKAPQLEIEAEHRSLPAFNSKVSPAGGAEFYHYHQTTAGRDDMSESFGSIFRDPCKTQIAEKKPKKWSKGWNLWGLIQRKGNGKDRSANANAANANAANHFVRSNSSVSGRSSFSGYGAASMSMRRNSVDVNGKKRRDEFVLERNRSARFSPGRVDNGLLRFYLTPMRGSQSARINSGVRPVSTNSHSLSTRPINRLY